VCLLLLEKNTIFFLSNFLTKLLKRKKKKKHFLKQKQVPICDVQLMCGSQNVLYGSNIMILILFLC